MYYQPTILLTGFTPRDVLTGVAGLDGSMNTDHPENGDFLGASVFPWAAKVIFSLPTYYSYVQTQVYEYEYDQPLQDSINHVKARYLDVFTYDDQPIGYKMLKLDRTQSIENPTDTLTLNSDNKLTPALIYEALENECSIDITQGTNGSVYKGGSGITVVGTTITNTGVTNITSEDGSIEITKSGTSYDLSNKGVKQITAGPGISISGSNGNFTISNTGSGEFDPYTAWSQLEWSTDFYYTYANGFGLFEANLMTMETDDPEFTEVPRIWYRHLDGTNYTEIRVA
jgi:hypothetical protein